MYKRGLPQFVAWIEEDQDRAVVRKKESDAEREKEAKRAHATFLRRKDETRIRLPTADEVKVRSTTQPLLPACFEFRTSVPTQVVLCVSMYCPCHYSVN